MKTTKTKTKTAKPGKNGKPYTTIRLIEKQDPCADEFYGFLRDFGGEPIDGRDAFLNHIGATGSKRKPKIGPDTPIPLAEILSFKRGTTEYMSGAQRVTWLLTHGCVQNEAMLNASIQDLTQIVEGDMDDLVPLVCLIVDKATLKKLLK